MSEEIKEVSEAEAELSAEADKEKSEHEKREAYKAMMKWRVSKDCQKIIERHAKEAGKALEAVKNELSGRKKIELQFSELTKLNSFCNLVTNLANGIDESEGGKKLKEHFLEQVQRGLTHVYGKVELGFDAPSYTKLDLLKDLLNFHSTIERRIDEAINSLAPQEETKPDLHPYENQ